MRIINELLERYPRLSARRDEIENMFSLVKEVFLNGGTLYTCGNGGSAADSEHIVGELMKSFIKKRPIGQDIKEALCRFGSEGAAIAEHLEGGLPCISLTSHLALTTAYANDNEPQATFAQQLFVLGKQNDALIVLSTSGNSQNCVYAAIVAKAKGMKVLALTGEKESKLSALADCTLRVPETETFKVQELHLPVYHALCAYLEEAFF